MQKNKNGVTSFAMQAGFGLGGFWIFKYLFVIGATQYPSLEYVNGFLIFFTPLLLLFYLVQFKNAKSENTLKYWEGVRFGITLFFFASIIESVIVIMHIAWIDPSFISKVNQQTIEIAESLNFSEAMMDELKRQSIFSPIAYVFRQILSNVFIGFILSLMLSPVASRINIEIKNLNK